MVRTRSTPVKVEATSSTQHKEDIGPRSALMGQAEKSNGPTDFVVRPMTKWAKTPTTKRPNATWMDLYISEYYIIPPQSIMTLVTNFQSAFMPNCHGVISPKNDTLQKYGLMVHTKVVLPGTMEEISIQVTNVTNENVVIPRHASLAFMALMQVATIEIVVLKTESALPTIEQVEPRLNPEPEGAEEVIHEKPCPKRKKPWARRLDKSK